MCKRYFLMATGMPLLLAAGAALAGAESAPAPFNISNAQDFAQQAAAVRSGLQSGGEYANLSARDRDLVMRDIDLMTALMQRRGSIEAMSGGERVRMFNAQSESNRLLTGDVSDYVICDFGPQTGSHLPSTQCWAGDGI